MGIRPATRCLGLAWLCLALLACSGGASEGAGDEAEVMAGEGVGKEAGTETATDTDAATETDTATATETGLPTEALAEAATEAETVTETGTEPVPETVAETAPETGAEAVAETATEVTPDCLASQPFDYHCVADLPETCPGGLCAGGFCIGPKLDPDRWAECADGACAECESATSCPADCAPYPTFTGHKEYDAPDTITVWVHGFWNKSADEMATTVYGADRGCDGLEERMRAFGVTNPCSDEPGGATAPNQMTKVEYYGGVAPEWMSPEDQAEIEAFPYSGETALERYARIVAKFVRHKLTSSGARFVNLTCHSFGCLITRHVIEHDLEGLASGNHLVRWATNSAVLAGARLARWYDNSSVQEVAGLIGLELSDFVVMNPDFVQDRTVVWDHRMYEANSPYFKGMIIHNACATDPHVKEALNITLLDLVVDPTQANDGIMYTDDEYFHGQQPSNAFVTPNGKTIAPTHTTFYEYHMQYPESDSAAVLAAAGLFHHRKVMIRLHDLTLKEDREADGPFDFSETGAPPAEVVVESQVRYDPYLHDVFGIDVLVHEARLAHRTPDVILAEQDQTVLPNQEVFSAPIFDAMDSLRLDLWLLEADEYPRYDLHENPFDTDEILAEFHGQVPLVDGYVEIDSEYAHARLEVRVVTLY